MLPIPEELIRANLWASVSKAPLAGFHPFVRVSLPEEYARDWSVVCAPAMPARTFAFGTGPVVEQARMRVRAGWGKLGGAVEWEADYPANGAVLPISGCEIAIDLEDPAAGVAAGVLATYQIGLVPRRKVRSGEQEHWRRSHYYPVLGAGGGSIERAIPPLAQSLTFSYGTAQPAADTTFSTLVIRFADATPLIIGRFEWSQAIGLVPGLPYVPIPTRATHYNVVNTTALNIERAAIEFQLSTP